MSRNKDLRRLKRLKRAFEAGRAVRKRTVRRAYQRLTGMSA